MTLTTRTILMLILAAPSLFAQEAAPAAPEATTTTTTASTGTRTTAGASTTDTATTDTAAETTTTTATDTAATTETTGETGEPEPSQASFETRNQFTRLLQSGSPDLIRLLLLEPNLLNNEEFLVGYPEVAQFVKEHPEVASRPRVYLAELEHYNRPSGPDIIEPLATIAGFLLVSFAFGWVIRMIIEQKRWSRLSRTQTEVHNKILDRFGTSNELLEYIKTPAGSKFLESAPIPLHVEPVKSANSPTTKAIWSIQLGVIIAAAGFGMLLVSFRYANNDGQGLFALGAIGVCVGLGFVASAAVSLILSRRLAEWQGTAASDDTGIVR